MMELQYLLITNDPDCQWRLGFMGKMNIKDIEVERIATIEWRDKNDVVIGVRDVFLDANMNIKREIVYTSKKTSNKKSIWSRGRNDERCF